MLKNRTLLCVSMMLLGLSQIALAAEEVSVDETHSNEPLVEASSDSATAVSYTHLDVYKRQYRYRAKPL